MAAKKKSPSSEKQLKAVIKRLENKLERADLKVARWKKEAKQQSAAAASSRARVTKLDKRLAEVARPAREASTTSDAQSPPPASPPDQSWTVVRLRAEARTRGLAGLSGASKAKLLAALA